MQARREISPRATLMFILAMFSGCSVDTDGYTFVSMDDTEIEATSDATLEGDTSYSKKSDTDTTDTNILPDTATSIGNPTPETDAGTDTATKTDTTSDGREDSNTLGTDGSDTSTATNLDTNTSSETDSSEDTVSIMETATETDEDTDNATDSIDPDTESESESDTDTDTDTDTDINSDTTPPTIVNISPNDDAEGVHSDATIVISFSESMDEASVEGAISISSVLEGDLDFSWNDDDTQFTITPGTDLVYATGTNPDSATAREYTVSIGTEATDVAGNSMAAPFVSTFTTLRRITQELESSISAYYYTYTVTTSDYVAECSDDSSFKIGYQVNTNSSGTWHGLAAFETDLPNTITRIEVAEIQATQTTPDGDFYISGIVELEQLEYQAIDSTIPDAIQRIEFGTFCDSDTIYPSMDITSAFAADFSDGQTDYLFRFNSKGGANNTFAMFKCQSFTMTVQYLLP